MARAMRLLVWLGIFALGMAGRAVAEISQVDGGIKFTYVSASATTAAWAGAFNAWSTSANLMTKTGDTFSVVIPLTPGEQEYKFVVDGQWIADPDNSATKGEFGNSLLKIGADGKIIATRATSNTALNPKILMDGRFLTYYINRRNLEGDRRFDLRRPDFDLDLNFNVRMSDVLDAHILTNIHSQTEDVQFFKSRLNFDRGSIHLHSDQLNLLAFDNDRVETWDDPLHLVGNIGIYHHDFGYTQQGMQLQKRYLGTDVQVLYADGFTPGGTDIPAGPRPLTTNVVDDPAFRVGLQRAFPKNVGANAKDVLAGRLTRAVGPGIKLGLSGRWDRGQDPHRASYFRADSTAADGTRRSGYETYRSTVEFWWGAGPFAELKRDKTVVNAEFLHGENGLEYLNAAATQRLFWTLETVKIGNNTYSRWVMHAEPALDQAPVNMDFPERMASDNRFYLGLRTTYRSTDLEASLNYHHSSATGLANDSTEAYSLQNFSSNDNHVAQWHLGAARLVKPGSLPGLDLRLDLDYFDFGYDRHTPWQNQFWFDRHNFWLESGEHLVSFDRLTLLGGNNVVTWKPVLSTTLWQKHDFKFRYAGTFNAVKLGGSPKFMESIFQFEYRLTAQTTLHSDTRWAHYNDPVLRLHDGYACTWLEGRYAFSPGITFSLGLGVDPNIIDTRVNEFGYIGRDAFLFEHGANGVTAERDFYGLSTLIPAAEKALELERRIQIKGVVNF